MGGLWRQQKDGEKILKKSKFLIFHSEKLMGSEQSELLRSNLNILFEDTEPNAKRIR